jgi:hypothetical protein
MSDPNESNVESVPEVTPETKPVEETEPETKPVEVTEPETKPVEETEPEPVHIGMTDEELNTFVNQTYNEYKKMVVPLNINVTNFVMLVTKTVKKVCKVKEMTPEQKFDTTLLILTKLVDEIPNVDDNDRYYLNNVVPSLINIVQDTSDGKLKLKSSKFQFKKRAPVDVQKVIDDLYEHIKSVLRKKNYGAEYIATNVVIIVGMIMTGVEQYSVLTGMEKKAVVVSVFEKIIDELPVMYPKMNDELKSLLQNSKLILPNVIDMLVSVGRKTQHFNFEHSQKLWQRLLCC